MIKIVVDTNVLISGTFWEGNSFRIIQMIEQKKVRCFLSKEILQEYEKVLHSDQIIEKTQKKQLEIKSAIIKAIEMCDIVEPKRKITFVKEDPDDDKILECAVEAKVDYILTNDQRHLLKIKEFEGIKLVSPANFLRIVNELDLL